MQKRNAEKDWRTSKGHNLEGSMIRREAIANQEREVDFMSNRPGLGDGAIGKAWLFGYLLESRFEFKEF